jgi:hypothetical protein
MAFVLASRKRDRFTLTQLSLTASLAAATLGSSTRCLTNVAADKHFSDAASPQW